MKLIIDIPEEAYEYVKATSYLGWLTTSEYAYIIKNGTPLDSTCSNCKFASLHCDRYDQDVAACDCCNNWEGEE